MAEVRPVRGGDRLNAYLAKLAKKVANPATLRVGFLENATYPDGTSVATVAAIQNFGAKGIPKRPFFTKLVNERAASWGASIGNLLKMNDNDATATLNMAGAAIAGQLRQAIVEMNSPPLSPITLMLRKMRADDPDLQVTGATVGEAARRVAAGEAGLTGTGAKPLVDTGVMLASVDYEVSTRG